LLAIIYRFERLRFLIYRLNVVLVLIGNETDSHWLNDRFGTPYAAVILAYQRLNFTCLEKTRRKIDWLPNFMHGKLGHATRSVRFGFSGDFSRD